MHMIRSRKGMLLLAVFILTLLSAPSLVSAQATNAITVSGTGIVTTDPNIGYFDIGVETVGTQLQDTFSRGSTTMEAVRTALLSIGVAAEDIQILDVVLNPEDRLDPRTGPTGEFLYRVTNSVRLVVRDVTRVNELTAIALQNGANSISNLTLGVQDIEALETEARTRAIAEANDRAVQYAAALGVRVGAVQYINEIGITSGFGATPVNVADTTGRFTVTVQVQITFAIRR
jgi:uncharacterized protein